MRIRQRLFGIAFAVAVFPAPSFAFDQGQAACRDTIASQLTRYVNSVEKMIVSCNSKRSAGVRPLSDDCNDVDVADSQGKLAGLRSGVHQEILDACSTHPALLDNYPSCPSPSPDADDGGATDDIDDFGELADCLTALADAHAGNLGDDAQGKPTTALLSPLRKCQQQLGKGTSRIAMTYMKERRRCQKAADATGNTPFSCASDPRGKVSKSVAKFQDKAADACDFSPEVLSKLNACAGDAQSLIDCADVAAELAGSTLIHNAYELIEENFPTSTTTTTTTSTTTTTLPGTVACGDAPAPTCDGNCPGGSSCTNDGGSCSCHATGTGPCAPASIRRIIHAKYGSPSGPSSLSTGWSGKAHDVDIPDKTGDVVDVTCDSNCENCQIDLNVQEGDPASNCRCTADSTKTCTVINGSDAESCGSVDPTCRCYFGAPLPLSSGGTPACVINRIRQDYGGTMNLRTGEWHDQIRLASLVYLGIDTAAPCPTCQGDEVLNDGVRGGTCAGGLNSNACDANGEHATFGATSFDCLPVSAANVSGSGLLVKLDSSTGALSLDATLPCDTPIGGDCHCRVCSGNGNLGCASDADCEEAGSGVCTVGGGAGVKKNECDSFACDSNGQCTTGPIDSYCDGLTHPDGRGFIPCTSDSDCTSNSAGTCTVQDLRRCFPDPLVISGQPSTFEPIGAAEFCIAATSNPAINIAGGLPGAGTFKLSYTADIRCQNDRSVHYEFPAGANCNAIPTTTTTTLLPSTCDDAVAPSCGGTCSDPSQICQSDGGGGCHCAPLTLPQCGEAEAPLCGGLCPTGEICNNVGGSCECGAPGVSPCASATAPVCGGICDTGEVCVASGSLCVCQSLGLPVCGASTPEGGCLGTCSVGSTCQTVNNACQCVGIPLP